ncbi:MAG: hypothetical protein AVDCRST_MAG40-125, partial [uncultured Gemmatimonadaceae bacterium]
ALAHRAPPRAGLRGDVGRGAAVRQRGERDRRAQGGEHTLPPGGRLHARARGRRARPVVRERDDDGRDGGRGARAPARRRRRGTGRGAPGGRRRRRQRAPRRPRSGRRVHRHARDPDGGAGSGEHRQPGRHALARRFHRRRLARPLVAPVAPRAHPGRRSAGRRGVPAAHWRGAVVAAHRRQPSRRVVRRGEHHALAGTRLRGVGRALRGGRGVVRAEPQLGEPVAGQRLARARDRRDDHRRYRDGGRARLRVGDGHGGAHARGAHERAERARRGVRGATHRERSRARRDRPRRRCGRASCRPLARGTALPARRHRPM